MGRLIYLDNAATTKMDHEVFEAMQPYFEEEYGNPSGVYSLAAKAAKAVFDARRTVAGLLGADAKEIYFTGGGSESDNWAIKSAAFSYRDRGNHIITTKIEHHAVLRTCEFLERSGFEVTYLDVDETGMVEPEAVRAAVRPTTILISVMTANNEIGTLEPIREIGEIARECGVLFHTDAVQAYGHIPLNVEKMHIDLLSASGHKLYGPKGVGILYVRDAVKIEPFIHGGSQERGMRAGTLNTPDIVGFAKATELAVMHMDEWAARETGLRDHLIDSVLKKIPYSRLNGRRENRLPNNASFCFRFVEGESLLILLDQSGICASGGSACTFGLKEPSHVLRALGVSEDFINGSLRLSLSHETTKEDIDFAVERLADIVSRLRSVSPAYAESLKRGLTKA